MWICQEYRFALKYMFSAFLLEHHFCRKDAQDMVINLCVLSWVNPTKSNSKTVICQKMVALVSHLWKQDRLSSSNSRNYPKWYVSFSITAHQHLGTRGQWHIQCNSQREEHLNASQCHRMELFSHLELHWSIEEPHHIPICWWKGKPSIQL